MNTELEANRMIHLHRLAIIAKREQWRLEELDWSRIDFQPLPHTIQHNLATIFAHLLCGEQAALQCVQRLHSFVHHPIQKQLCEFQITDEKRHCAFFSQLMSQLVPPAAIRTSMSRLMHDIYSTQRLECLLVGMHIVIESLAQSLFQAASTIIQKISDNSPIIASIKYIVLEWIPKLLAADESRHIAFGHILISSHLPSLNMQERENVEKTITRWGHIIHDMACDPILLYQMGMMDMTVSTRCIKDVNLRLRQLDLNVQIPLPAAI